VIVITSGLTRLLTRAELAAVIAHELAHIKHRDTLPSTVVATIAGMIALIATGGPWGAWFRPAANEQTEQAKHWLGKVLLVIVTPIAAMLIRLGMSRTQEYLADECGAALLGDPLPLASALEKVEWATQQIPMRSNPGMAPLYFVHPLSDAVDVLRMFRTHPPTEHRIACLRSLAQRDMHTNKRS
jgi:heat shock protein HtpX